MAQELFTPQIPGSFKGLLSGSKVVQKAILERNEKKYSLLEGRRSVILYSSADSSPPSLNNELNLSSPNFIALGESFFLAKFKYTVKDNRTNGSDHYEHWTCPTSPGFSFFRNIRVELNGTEVTQSSKISDMQSVQHVLSLLESDVSRLQYSDSDLYGLQKLDTRKALKNIHLDQYRYGVKRKRAYAFMTNDSDGDDFDSTAGNYKVKRKPGVLISETESFSNTVQENIVRTLCGRFQYKMRPFLPFFNADDAWLPPGTQVKIKFDLPQAELSRYMIVSDKGGGANNADSVGNITIELTQLDFIVPTYRMDHSYVDQVRLSKQLFFHTWCPRQMQKSITDDAGTIELLHNSDIPRRFLLFFEDLKSRDQPALGTGNATHSSNRLAMIHANISQLRITVNEETLFDSPLKFDWMCSVNEDDGTYFYDYNKSSYLRGYNLVREFFGKTYGTEIPITAADYCNHYFMIPINLNLDHQVDNQKMRGNLSIDYQFSAVTNSPIKLPSDQSTSIKVNMICLDQYLYTIDKERGVKSEVV
ncbi:uncharacterized protein LOC135818113 [Sycon ciliatum]|uniref:uncharacterized protein LOC135818113 n=1 Tax=Sycon ciliatum TaxID=27933 RepID=UPI0031F68BF8